MSELTALASENLNPSLRSLLEDVQDGYIRVPRFQRPFLWDDDQRIELLESIRDNMPIGSLLVWSTSNFELACFPKVGPHDIPSPINSSLRGQQYLLDGHQRVSTLLGVLLTPSQSKFNADNTDDSEAVDWDIQYDLSEQEFLFVKKAKWRIENHPLLPLSTLLDGRLVNKHMRSLRARSEQMKWTEEEVETWEERADQLSYRFQQYRIPIVVMVTNELELAARTFQRINSQGTPMGEAHLVAALTWTSKFDLRERLAAIREGFPPGWRELEDKILLQVCKSFVAPDISKVDENQLVAGIKKDNRILDRAANCVQKAIDLLVDKCGVVRADLLPYSAQIIYLAIEFSLRKDKMIPEDQFVSWFWRTGWTEIFGSASFRQLRAEQENLRKMRIGEAATAWKGEWTAPKTFDPRHARIRAWMLRVAVHSNLVDHRNEKVDAIELLARHGKYTFAKLIQAPPDSSPKFKMLCRSIGNRFIVDPSQVASFHKILLGNKSLPESFLEAHFLNRKSLSCLRAGEVEKFLELRTTAVKEWEMRQWDNERNLSHQYF